MATTRLIHRTSPPLGAFPLSATADGRGLQRPDGTRVVIVGSTDWQAIGNLTLAQMDTLLETRAAQGFNASLIEAPAWHFSTETPRYIDVDGNAPFTSTSYSAASFVLVDAYWDRVDYYVAKAKALDMAVLMSVTYLGFGGGAGVEGDQGIDALVDGATDQVLYDYGVALGQRYTQSNIVWVHGGDFDAPNPEKCWKVAEGIISVRPNDMHTFHGARGTEGYTHLNGRTDWTGARRLNTTYSGMPDNDEVTKAAAAYARSGPIPFIHVEGWYELDGNLTDTGLRRQAYASWLSGACGHMYGHNNVWGFGGYGSSSAQDSIDNYLQATVANDMQHFAALTQAYTRTLVPKTDTSLITTAQGSGADKIVGALADDDSYALVWTPTQNFTIDMSALSPSSVRGRWFDPTAGTYSAASGSPYSNTGTQAFTAPGERILVLDSA